MWKRGGRSSALDRAEALLSARRTSGGVGQPGPEGSLHGCFKTRSAPPQKPTFISDLSDLSSDCRAHERGADADGSANVEIEHTRDRDRKRDLRPQSSLGGQSRFLKKAPPPTNSSQSPVSRNQRRTAPAPRHVSTSQSDSQSAVTSRQAAIESHSPELVLERDGQGAQVRTSELEVSPSPEVRFQSTGTSGPLSARSSSEQNQRGNRFLRMKATGPAGGANAAPAAGARSRSRAGPPAMSSGHLELKSADVKSGVNLESDEEDMRKLLGDSVDSSDCSASGAGRPSSTKRPEKVGKIFHRGSLGDPSTAPPRSPASPSCRNSPFRFTGVAQAHFSPSVLSPSPSPPRISPSPKKTLASSPETGPECSLSWSSGRGEVFSLEELGPAGPDSEGPRSETASVSSEDFKINVMTLDQLVPASNGVPSEKTGTESQSEKEEEDYQSDFESDASATQVSERLRGDADEDDAPSEVRKGAFDPDRCPNRTDDDYSSVCSDQSCSSTSRTSDHSQRSNSFSRSRESRSWRSGAGSTSFQQSRRRGLKDVQVQTQPNPDGAANLDPTVRMIYMSPGPVVTHTVSGERLEGISSFNPAVFVVNEVLKQQLAMTRQFINSSQHLHRRLLQNLEPPSYRYTTLEETMQNIRKHRTPRLTMEDALEEVLQEMRGGPGSSARSRETAGFFT